MARIRYLKPDFFKDEDLAKLPFETRLFFAGLWCLADKAGRLEDRPERLKIEIFPYDDVDIERCLQQLAEPKKNSGQPFINRYQTGKQRYIQIINWNKHQKPHHTEKESQIPPTTPLMEKGMGMGMGMEKQHEVSTRLSNGDITVKQPNTHTIKDLQIPSTPLLNNRSITVKPPLNYTLQQVKDACILNGVPESNAQSYFDQYNSQDWKKGNGQPITNLQSHMAKRWLKSKQCWDFDERKQQKTQETVHEQAERLRKAGEL